MAKTGPKPRSIEVRFWPKVDVRKPDECWPWRAAVKGGRSQGYGEIWFREKVVGAHRVAFFLKTGVFDGTRHVDHLCHNRLCCNASHMELVAPSVNKSRRKPKNVKA